MLQITAKRLFGWVVLFVFVMAVSASMTEKFLKIPLFQVGEMWVSSVSKVNTKILNYFLSLVDVYSFSFYIFLAVAAVTVYYTYCLLFVPLNRVRLLGDIGYLPEGKMSKKDLANAIQKRRVVGEVPPVYPNGWFGVMESFYLRRGESKPVSVLGENLAVFRSESGEVHILDAYCPHMGANLGAGGQVVGDCIECPFHGWLFRGHDGKCTKIPYAEKVPDVAKVKSWPVREINGWIYIWYHAEGAEPNWTPPELEEITNGNWVYRGRTEHHVNAHIEEIPENGADVAHLAQVHTPSIAAGIDLSTMWSRLHSFAFHTWTAQWSPKPEPESHVGLLRLTHSLKIFGKTLGILDLNVTANQIGPGMVYLEFESFFGKGVFVQSLTPVEPMVQKLVHNIYMTWTVPTFIAKFFMFGEAIQVERDVMIWNNKTFQNRPLFVKSKEDSLVARHRRWYSQFYSENSPRLTFRKEKSLEW